jgi:hypothetical protein
MTKAFIAILSSNDKGESPKNLEPLLIAAYGKVIMFTPV